MPRDAAKDQSREIARIGARIDKAFGKLAKKMRRRAEKAKAAMVESQDRSKSVVLQRRFEMYTNAAHDIDQLLNEQRIGVPPIGSFKETGAGSAPAARVVP